MEQRRNILRGLAGAAVLWSAGPAWAQTGFSSRRITVSTRGQGPDLILIPGLASTADVWRGAADRLAGGRRLHLVSVRGFGDLPAGANASGGPWLLGERFSALDVYLGSQIGWGLQFKSLPERDAFKAYAGRLFQRPAAIRAREMDDALIAAASPGS